MTSDARVIPGWLSAMVRWRANHRAVSVVVGHRAGSGPDVPFER